MSPSYPGRGTLACALVACATVCLAAAAPPPNPERPADSLGALDLRLDHPAYADLVHGDTVRFGCGDYALVTVNHLAVVGACADDPAVGFRESVYVPPAPSGGLLSVMSCTFEARDACDNVGVLTVHVALLDTVAPTLEGVPPHLALPPAATLPTPAYVFAIDDCTRNLTVDLREERTLAADSLRVTRTWTARDEAGNVARGVQRIARAEATITSDACFTAESFSAEEAAAQTWTCDGLSDVRLPLLPDFAGTVSSGGRALALTAVDSVARSVYEVADLLPADDAGPFEVRWQVGDGVYRGRVGSVDSLLRLLAASEPAGAWRLDPTRRRIVGEVSTRYGTLATVSAHTGAQRAAEAHDGHLPTAWTAALPVGEHRLVATSPTGCADTAHLRLTCREARSRTLAAVVGSEGTHCFALPGAAADYAIELRDSDLAGVLDFGVAAEGCVPFEALEVGRGGALFEYCHRATGACERVRLEVEVFSRESQKPPTAHADLFGIAYQGQRALHVLANDEIVGEPTSLTVAPSFSRGSARFDAQGRLHYTAPESYCGEDRVVYEVCTSGGCDTASVVLQVTCESIIVFTGFSPNGDGVNDHFLVLGIENYPANRLVVFNQHGHEVYSRDAYANDWAGTYQGTPLLDGTYYYVLAIEGEEPRSGYVQIAR